MRKSGMHFSLLACGLWACSGTFSLSAAEPDSAPLQPADDAASLARRVLAAEADGDLKERSRLVLDLLESGAEGPVAYSISGKIRDRSGWKSVDAQIESNRQLPALERYERYRSSQPDSVRGHLDVAQWCQRAGLEAQQRAHCRRVLQLDPQNQIARTALGHRQIDGQWVTSEQMAQMNVEVEALRISLKKHGENLMNLAAEMMEDRRSEREEATATFLKLDDADAIPAVAAIFSTTPRPLIDSAIEWMSQQSHPDAAAVLARWSVDHPQQEVRELCIAALKERPVHEYVPLLLDRTRSPLISALIPSFRPDGSLAGVRHVFARETKDDFDVSVIDSLHVRRLESDDPRGPARLSTSETRGRGSLVDRAILERERQIQNALTEMRIRVEETRAARQREWIAAAENQSSEVVNDRISLVLSETSGTDPEATLHELWDWWADYTEREPAPMKLASFRYNMQLAASNYYGSRLPPPPVALECFVAGTSVVTSRGEKPIESIVVGDQVLSKDIETGELVWDAVVTTTEQPAKALVTVATDNDTFQCTGGHLFWVSGKGWTKARDLEYQDLLHGLSRPSLVRSVSEADEAPTYNLITATHHNYFVGEGRVLSHDFDEQTPTPIRVPGLANVAGR